MSLIIMTMTNCNVAFKIELDKSIQYQGSPQNN